MTAVPSSPFLRSPVFVTTLAVAQMVGFFALAGCATSLPATGEGSSIHSVRIVRVVAAENFWGSIVAQLGGTHARVVSIIDNPNTDPHAYEPTAADARVLADAQLAVQNGAGYDPWMPRLLAADGGSRTVLDVGSLVGVAPGGNPHLWYDSSYVEQFITTATDDLVRADPADGAYFMARRTAYEQVGLAGYHAALLRIRARYAGTPVGASESIVAYLCRSVGLDLVSPPTFLRAVSEGTDVSAVDMATIARQIQTRAIAVYVENTQNLTPNVQAQVSAARAAGIPRTAVTETLEPATTTFQAWQTAQLDSLYAALEKSRG